MTKMNDSKKNPEFKIGDIIEISMKIETLIHQEAEGKSVLDLVDYDTKYEINYSYPREQGFSTLDLTVKNGCSSDFNDDLQKYIEAYLKDDLAEIAEYELFDIDNTGEYQTAKIKVKAVK